MAIDKIIKSNRLLQSRRYTVASSTDSQEAFTSVLDINAGEVYTQQSLLPTSSLPYSGSSQSGLTYSVGGEQILKYYYRQTLTPSNVVSGSFTDAYFFIDPYPGAPVTPQLLQTGQQNSFISSKYSSPTLANSDTEDTPPGYNVAVFVAGTKQNPANYQFDYKNGVLEFLSSPPTTGQTVTISAYQYIGKTLNSFITNGYSGSFSGSFQGNGTGLTNIPASSIVGLNLTQIATATVSASVSSTGNSFTLSSASVNLFTVDSGSKVTATTFSGSLIGASNTTGSLTGSFIGIGSGSFSGSFQGSSIGISNATGSLTGSFRGIGSGSFSGSFQGNGSGLTNLSASSVVGLDLTRLYTGSVTASVNVGATTFQIISGSTTLLSLSNTGDLTVSGSEFIGNNITAVGNAVVTGSLTVNGVTNLGNTLTVNASSSLRNTTVTGSMLVTQNLTVLGTASFTSITGSRIVIGSPTITLSTDTPAVRFGGMLVVDSGSFGGNSTGSLLWDSQEDRWIYVTPSGSTEGYNSAIIIGGPPNTGSIGSEPGLTIGRIMKAVGDDHIGSSLMRETGSAMAIDGTLSITGSTLLSSPDGTVTNKYALVTSQSAWHYSDNVGYPAGTNQWGTNLNGSYFNNFTPNTDTATIMRFVAGLLSASAPAPSPNTKTYGSLTNNNPSLSTGTISGYIPQDISGSDLLYLNNRGFANTGSTIFNGVGTVYTNLNPTYAFTSVFGGSTSVTSSADIQLFGLGTTGLSFNVSGALNWRFDDNYLQVSTATSSSQALATLSSFGSSGGLTLAEIPTANPAVIPNTYQDGKFVNVFSTSFYTGSRSATSVSSSGWYHISASIGYSTGSSVYTTFNTNYTKVFAAPISSIVIPTQAISFTQSIAAVTATSRSLSGAPYLQGATWTYSITSSGVFEPLYYGNSTIFNITDDSSLVTLGGTVTQAMSGGTISGTSLVYSTSSVQRATGTIPFRTDRLQSSNTSTLTTSTGNTNIGQSTISPTGYNITTVSYDRSGGTSTTSSAILFHSASTFGQPLASGSMGYYGSAQGYDGGALTGASETFTGESYRLKITGSLLSGSYTNGTKFTTVSYEAYNLGGLDLQVKPGYLVRPGSNYGYWLADPNSSKTYKYYARAFQVSTAYSTLYLDLGKTLNNWTSTSDGVSVAIIFNSVFGGGNLSGTFGNSYPVLFDISALTSTSILTGQANNDFTNPFAEPINVYGNNGGTLSTTKYGLSLLSGLKQILNPSASPTPYVDFVVLVRYTNQNAFTPVTTITQTNS